MGQIVREDIPKKKQVYYSRDSRFVTAEAAYTVSVYHHDNSLPFKDKYFTLSFFL